METIFRLLSYINLVLKIYYLIKLYYKISNNYNKMINN